MVSRAWNRSLRLALFLSMAVLVVQLAGPARTAHSSTNWQVIISGGTFNPNYVAINVGDSVTWINNDGTVHSSVSDPNPLDHWNSGGIADGTNFTYTFNTAGRFPYFCDVHPDMTGTVVVSQPVPEFPGSLVFLTLAVAIAAALLAERSLARRA